MFTMKSWKRSDGALHNLTLSMHQSLVLMILDQGLLLSNPSFCTDDDHDGDVDDKIRKNHYPVHFLRWLSYSIIGRVGWRLDLLKKAHM